MREDRQMIQGIISCPFCQGTKTIVYKGTTGRASVKCANCGKFYSADFENMRAEKSGAIKNGSIA